MVADSTTIRFKSNATPSLGQFSASTSHFNQRIAPAIADTITFSHQAATVAPQFGMKKNWLLALPVILGATLFAPTSCTKPPVDEIESPTTDIDSWDKAIATKTATTTQGPNGTQTTVNIEFKKFEDGVSIEFPTGPATIKQKNTTYKSGSPEEEERELLTTVVKTSNGLSFTFDGAVTDSTTLILPTESEVQPRTFLLPNNISLKGIINSTSPKEMWAYGNTPEAKNKSIFSTVVFNEGVTPTYPDMSGFSDIEGAKVALSNLLTPWGATPDKVNKLKAHFDDPTFISFHSNVPAYMVATLINEVKSPGHLASIMGANSQNAPFVNKTGTADNSSAGTYLEGGARLIKYGKHAYKLPPQVLALLQRTEVMENNGPAGAQFNSKNEQLAQKLVMLGEYANVLEKDPSVAAIPHSYILAMNAELLMLLNSGNPSIDQRIPGNILGQGANNFTDAVSYADWVKNKAYSSTSNNQTTPIPEEMKKSLQSMFGITAGDVYDDALINTISNALRKNFNWEPVLRTLRYSPSN